MKENLMKPVIGIFPSYDNERNQNFIDSVYVDEIVDSGGIPFIIPLSVLLVFLTNFHRFYIWQQYHL